MPAIHIDGFKNGVTKDQYSSAKTLRTDDPLASAMKQSVTKRSNKSSE